MEGVYFQCVSSWARKKWVQEQPCCLAGCLTFLTFWLREMHCPIERIQFLMCPCFEDFLSMDCLSPDLAPSQPCCGLVLQHLQALCASPTLLIPSCATWLIRGWSGMPGQEGGNRPDVLLTVLHSTSPAPTGTCHELLLWPSWSSVAFFTYLPSWFFF